MMNLLPNFDYHLVVDLEGEKALGIVKDISSDDAVYFLTGKCAVLLILINNNAITLSEIDENYKDELEELSTFGLVSFGGKSIKITEKINEDISAFLNSKNESKIIKKSFAESSFSEMLNGDNEDEELFSYAAACCGCSGASSSQ